MVLWWERLPSNNHSEPGSILALAPYLDWRCHWFLLWSEGFTPGSPILLPLQNLRTVWYPTYLTNWIYTTKFNATTCNYLTEFCNHTRASTHQSSVKLIILLKNCKHFLNDQPSNFNLCCNMMNIWLVLSVFRVLFNISSERTELVFTAGQNILNWNFFI